MNDNPRPTEEIAALAYRIWEEEGRPEGKSDEHWARAQRCLREQRVPLPDLSEKNIPTTIPEL